MNTTQLLKCIGEDEKLTSRCSGVFPLDRIPTPTGRPKCIIINLDPGSKPGSHWVAIYIDREGFGDFFDSYGHPPQKREIRNYLKKYCKDWTFNEKQIQSNFSSACGQYCIYFLYRRVRDVSMRDVVSVFTDDLRVNDSIVTEWVNEKFDVDTDVYDLEFMINQICSPLEVDR